MADTVQTTCATIQTIQDGPRLLSQGEVELRLGISHGHFTRLKKDGKFIPPVMVGSRVMFDAAKVQKWIDNGGAK